MKLLFIHGAGGGREEWLYQTRHFPDAEAVALTGHPEGTPLTTVEKYAEWLHDYIRQRGYKDIVLVGHSMGGGIVQTYGLNYGAEIKALVLVGTGARLRVAPSLLDSTRQMRDDAGLWRKYLDDIYADVDPEAKQQVIAERLVIGPDVMLNDMVACDSFDIMSRVSEIRLPTLIICGSQDSWTPLKYSHYLASKIAGAREVIIEGASHWAFLEKPDEVNRAIEEFLQQIPAPVSPGKS